MSSHLYIKKQLMAERAAVFHSWWKAGDLLVVIDAGLDESRSDSGLLVVSAVAGQTSQMKKLDKLWSEDLAEDNVDFFHAKEHWNGRSKAYHGLSQRKRQTLLAKLIHHIHKFGAFGVSVCINTAEYQDVTTQRFRSDWGSAYSFAIQLLFILIHFDLRKRNRLHETVNLLIEDGHANSRQILEIVSKAQGRKDYWVNLGTYGLGGKVGNPVLQAADMLAYGSCQHHSKGESRIYKQLVYHAPIPFATLPWNKSCIESIKKDIEAYLMRIRVERQEAKKRLGEILLSGDVNGGNIGA